MLPLVTVQAMYKSLIMSRTLDTAALSGVWGTAGITALQRLQKLQNRAMRIVMNSAYDAQSESLIQKLRWPTIKHLIESETGKVVYSIESPMVYKALLNEAPTKKRLFHRPSDTQSRVPRNSNTDLRIPLFKTSSGQKSFEFRGARVWNNPRNEGKRAITFLAFRCKL